MPQEERVLTETDAEAQISIDFHAILFAVLRVPSPILDEIPSLGPANFLTCWGSVYRALDTHKSTPEGQKILVNLIRAGIVRRRQAF